MTITEKNNAKLTPLAFRQATVLKGVSFALHLEKPCHVAHALN